MSVLARRPDSIGAPPCRRSRRGSPLALGCVLRMLSSSSLGTDGGVRWLTSFMQHVCPRSSSRQHRCSALPTLAEGFSARARLRPEDAVFLLARDRRRCPMAYFVHAACLSSLVVQTASVLRLADARGGVLRSRSAAS